MLVIKVRLLRHPYAPPQLTNTSLQSLAPLAVLLGLAIASPVERSEPKPLEVRQSATTCGSTSYTAAQVRAAANAACSYYQAGDTAGSSTYPHTYNNYESVLTSPRSPRGTKFLTNAVGVSTSPSAARTRSSLFALAAFTPVVRTCWLMWLMFPVSDFAWCRLSRC